jgi:[ribosomal protein S5]-alanine N-acetyltransferase
METSRLIFRPLSQKDDVWLPAVLADGEVMRFSMGVLERDGIARWLLDRIAEYERDGFGVWAVAEKASGEMIGYCGLLRYLDVNGAAEVEVAYRLMRHAWGKGYATEAVMETRDYAFRHLKLKRLIAIIDPANLASIRVAEKAGFSFESTVMLDGYDYPDRVYVASNPVLAG